MAGFLSEIFTFHQFSLILHSLNKRLKGKLGYKEEEEEEEHREWTDYENLFSLVILLTDLQRPWWRQSSLRVGGQSNFH